MSRAFTVLLNKVSDIQSIGRIEEEAAGRFNYASSRLRDSINICNPFLLDTSKTLKQIHQSLREAGFQSSKGNEGNQSFFQACENGSFNCEQAVFLYLALLNELGLEPTSSLINDRLSVVSMHNSELSHASVVINDSPHYFWEATLDRNNLQPSNTYKEDFSFIKKHSVRDTLETLTNLFCLDLIKDDQPDLYLRELENFDRQGTSYPSEYFYSIEIINKLAGKIVREKETLTHQQLNQIYREALTRLEELRFCPYLYINDIEANIEWFKDNAKIDTLDFPPLVN